MPTSIAGLGSVINMDRKVHSHMYNIAMQPCADNQATTVLLYHTTTIRDRYNYILRYAIQMVHLLCECLRE